MGMTHLLDKAGISVLVGAVVFLLAFVPGLVWQYRTYGRLSTARMTGLAGVCVYTAALVVYTLMPYPQAPSEAWCASHHASSNIVPLSSVRTALESVSGKSLWGVLHDKYLQQIVLNVALFVPFGVIVHRFLRRGALTTVLAGMLTSSFIEISQYTGMFGLYPCAFRVGDVDDVLTNTTGTLLGVLLAPVFLWWMPSSRQLAVKRLSPRPLTVWRRWTGMLVDALLLSGLTWTFMAVARFARRFAGLSWGPTSLGVVEVLACALLAVLVVEVGPAWRGRGSSLGQAAVWLTPLWAVPGAQGSAVLTLGTRAQRVGRSLVVAGPLVFSFVAFELEWDLPALVVATGIVVGGIDALLVPFTRTRRGLSGVVARCEFADVRTARFPTTENVTRAGADRG